MREVDLETFAQAHADGALVIDVREPMEYVQGHVPGAQLIPMGYLPSQIDELPTDRPVYVICETGNRSLAMTSYLIRAGIDAWSVAGGTSKWQSSGRPVVSGRHANAA